MTETKARKQTANARRGLSEEQARRLQIEGFVSDIVLHAGEVGEVLAEELTTKLEIL